MATKRTKKTKRLTPEERARLEADRKAKQEELEKGRARVLRALAQLDEDERHPPRGLNEINLSAHLGFVEAAARLLTLGQLDLVAGAAVAKAMDLVSCQAHRAVRRACGGSNP